MKSGQHDLTSARLLFVHLTVALLESQPAEKFMGQLKTLLAPHSLPAIARSRGHQSALIFSPGRTMGCITHSGGSLRRLTSAATKVEPLRPQLPPASADFLTAFAAALNDRNEIVKLDSSDLWRNSPLMPLDTPWSQE